MKMTLKYSLAVVTAVSLTSLTVPAQAALVNIPYCVNCLSIACQWIV
ncbi:hypothetical protein cce_4224 [Crocosphaera subtropica ATCC 51142]|uniref:Uncharacterized protein n=1 Tax=Crocosphaera subtropica (strain ATCC 51142 / BH68) TaxID=43989 RepID=B1WSJ3_CROS5|nr:hypothetical protein cce_4224 [Crocosphaera subtropica ATCC 51142]